MEGGGLIDALKKRLNRQGTFRADLSRSQFAPAREEVRPEWAPEDAHESSGLLNPMFLKKFFFIALIFFLLSIAASAYIIWSGSNVVSAENLEVTLTGPTSIKGGEELNIGITIANNNSTDLEYADLIVAFPPGTREVGALEKELSRYRKNLGTIKRGTTVNESVKAALFGEAGKEQEVKVALEYRTPGSNAIFEKIKLYKVSITASPIDIRLTMPAEVHAGNEVQFAIDLTADNEKRFNDLLLETQYPAGFRYKSSSPRPAFGNNVWDLGSVNAGGKRRITVIGVLDGEDAEKKFFKATAGIAAAGREGRVAVPYGSAAGLITMRRSFIDLSTVLNAQSAEEIIAEPGNTIRSGVTFRNNLPDKLLNAAVQVRFSGTALDQSAVSSGDGAYRSLDDTIVWTQQHSQDLAIIEPGASGQLAFDFGILQSSALASRGVSNPYVRMEISFDATRVSEGSPDEAVRSVINKMVRVNSLLSLGAEGLYSTGAFVNVGPMPPRPNQETSYTINWQAINTTNDLDGLAIRGTLPSNVRFTGVVSPVDNSVKYDSTTGLLTWNIGKVNSGMSKQVSFQVVLLPSVPQVEQTLPLITNISLYGRDLFTGTTLSDSRAVVDMRIDSDPNFQDTWSKVSP